MARTLKAIIDSAALKHNFAKVREFCPHQKIIAMIKANGYGHGMINVAKTLSDADGFGVACLEEAVQCRAAGISQRIFVMGGFYEAKTELPEILRLNLDLILHQEEQVINLIRFLNTVQNKNTLLPLKVWIKLNTGMNRLGFKPQHFAPVLHCLSQHPLLQIEGFMTHFANADKDNDPLTPQQIEIFFKTVQGLPGVKSLANSAGIMAWSTAHGDWVRPGIMLYGISPLQNRHGAMEGLKPIMSLTSTLIAIQEAKKGEIVGYGGRYVCPTDRRIGVVAAGYGDGYPRVAPDGTPVLLNGRRVPLVGQVSMDMIMIDLSSQPAAKVGDPVLLWGPGLPVEEVAAVVGTSAYELLTRLTTRVPLIW